MVSPHKYAQHRKQQLSLLVTSKGADMVFGRIGKEPWIVARNVGDIPCYIPAKYHRLLREILITAYMKAMFKKTTHQYSVGERHRIMEKVLMYTGNVRESAGR